MSARLGIEVVSSATSTALALNGNLRPSSDLQEQVRACHATAHEVVSLLSDQPFLRIPPFPEAQVQHFTGSSANAVEPTALADRLRKLRVGGTYWAAQPKLPANYILVRSPAAVETAKGIAEDRRVVCWCSGKSALEAQEDPAAELILGDCDPWHMLGGASAIVGEVDAELLVIASLLGVPWFDFDAGSGCASPVIEDHADLLKAICQTAFVNPFTLEPMDALQTAELCGFWRQLIDSNRAIAGGAGFAFWKQAHIGTLLWDGCTPFRFLRSTHGLDEGSSIAIWRSKTPSALLSKLQLIGCSTVEVEDGFLRSRGLGADCIPPLSITVDRMGVHFDPSRPNELEALLEHGSFDEALIMRARRLRSFIVEAGVGKYDCARDVVDRPAGTRRHILVPGQVDDDRAVQAGGCGLTSNLELLARVRAEAPDAYILYKPHPDVVAGHRRGAIARDACLRFADQIVGELPIASLIEMVDEVHVNTSLAGFEALLREKPVTAHGVPFYAGWGLTTDRGPVPKRRTKRRTLDELVAATLLLYPRYLDPHTGLPCPPEIIVARLSSSDQRTGDLLVGMRRLQGKFMRRLRSLVQ